MSKTAAIPMDKEIQSSQLIFTGQQYHTIISSLHLFSPNCFYNHRTDGKTEPLFSMRKALAKQSFRMSPVSKEFLQKVFHFRVFNCLDIS